MWGERKISGNVDILGVVESKRRAAKLFKDKLLKNFSDDIVLVILYGSTVKSRPRKDSDVDLLIVTSNDPRKIAKFAGNIWIETFEKTGEVIEPFFISLWEFEHLKEYGFLQSVLKEGEVLYKLSLKDVLRKEVEGYLSLAEYYLSHAKEDFKRGDYRVAADIGYNSLELTLRAMIRWAGKSLPSTHGGIIQVFAKEYVASGKLSRDIASKFNLCLMIRSRARYEPYAAITREDVKTIIETSEEILAWARKQLAQ
nr:HEPN domain-containing protein [Candidatus Baldrarchaeota archaeon]